MYDVGGSPPAPGDHVKVTVEPDSEAESEVGAAGSANARIRGAAAGCPSPIVGGGVSVVPHTSSLIEGGKIERWATDLVQHAHGLDGPSIVCADVGRCAWAWKSTSTVTKPTTDARCGGDQGALRIGVSPRSS